MDERTDLTDRAVIVRASDLDDVLELTLRLLERTDPTDPLAHALRGAMANIRCASIFDPS